MIKCDVAVIGGGPAGSTLGALLRKYDPSLEVVILERDRFPRDHVGESLLPAIMTVLEEMEVWDKVEAANFPIKIGATYRWGSTTELWFLDFIRGDEFQNRPRPEKFEGQRRFTTFQVDRSTYDKILLDHALELGCRVFEDTAVREVERSGDRITGLMVASDRDGVNDRIEARYYVDCSGEAGKLRRAMDIPIFAPTKLKNIAFWDYWQDATWAETYGNGGTHVQIMSLGWGWLWFIPISPTRTSIGLVLPADYFASSGKSPGQIYLEAVKADPRISVLVKSARCEGQFSATKDWNFLASRLAGENWFLAGDSCGFADPVLSAGLTLTHTSARKVAYTILEIERGIQDPDLLKVQYSQVHRDQIRHHIQFADFWYSSNGCFTDLKEYCSEIAQAAGISADPDEAFQWLASGGFALEEPGIARALTYRVTGVKSTVYHLSGNSPSWLFSKTNSWRFHLEESAKTTFPLYRNGRVEQINCFRRGAHLLPLIGVYQFLFEAMRHTDASNLIMKECVAAMIRAQCPPSEAPLLAAEAVEALINEGWIQGQVREGCPFVVLDQNR